jgi:hypothetical protein
MMGNTRRRPDRTSAVRRTGSGLEALETRQLLTGPTAMGMDYRPSVFPPRTISHFSPNQYLNHPIGSDPQYLSFLDNDGRLVSGKDRQGDEWTITVHGPGTVIVTDATPNDGVNDDDIDTILIQGSDPHRTYITGQVTASARVITDGQVFFNHLIATDGVQSIILNGFNLARTVVPPYGQGFGVGPEIYLPNGVKTLQFNNINATLDVAANDQPFDIVIGTPNTPIRQRPDIKIGSIFNTQVNSALGFDPNGVPVTDPTVNFSVNGDIHKIEMVSAGRAPNRLAGYDILFPTVGATGRTSIRALGIDHLKVYGSARNLTASRAGQPFQPQSTNSVTPLPTASTQPFRSPFSGLTHLGTAEFGGPTDALGLDVDGRIGHLKFRRGLGDPTGVMPGETNLGFNEARRGYPSFGFYGGLITAREIGSISAGPNNMILQHSPDPDFIQLLRQGQTHYFARPGNAFTFAAVTTDGNINATDIVGNAEASEIKTGFNYKSYLAGLEGTRSPSAINRLRMRGDQTALGFYGSGIYARTRSPHLPPPLASTRVHGVRVRP